MTTETVLDVAWVAAGSPAAGAVEAGTCARCGTTGKVVALGTVVSKNYTDFEGWIDATSKAVCSTCSWALSNGDLRRVPHIVQPGVCSSADLAEVRDLLAAGELPADAAVIVPLRPGRKHLLPRARWGCVTSDDLTMRWSAQDAHRLRQMAQLRAWGFTTVELKAAAAPFEAIRRVDVNLWSLVLDTWEDLAPWRQGRRPWMSLGLKVSIVEEK